MFLAILKLHFAIKQKMEFYLIVIMNKIILRLLSKKNSLYIKTKFSNYEIIRNNSKHLRLTDKFK